jgi:hypothetical protein
MHFGARYFSPTLGRFVSADSIVPGAGNPQAFNRYSYVLNSPLNYTDPTGHYECIDTDENGRCIREPKAPKASVPAFEPWEILLAQETLYAATRNGQFTMPQMRAIAHILINRTMESGRISDIVGTTELPCLWYGMTEGHCNTSNMPKPQAEWRAMAEAWGYKLNQATGEYQKGWQASMDAFNAALAEARVGIDPTHGSNAYTMLTRTEPDPTNPNPEALAHEFWWGTSLPGYYPRVTQYTNYARSHPQFRWSVTAPEDISILDNGQMMVALFTANDPCNYYLACGLP